MRKSKNKTQVWRPNEENFGKQKDILAFTMDQGVALNSYCWPAGFFADVNYMIDVPVILNKRHKNYKFDKLTRLFYEGMLEYFAMENTNHAFRPFGCDMAFIDAKVNYRIMEALL